MSGVLFLDRRMVNSDVKQLRSAIASHVESDTVAAELLAQILVARGMGDVDHVTLFRPHTSGDEPGRGWEVRVSHAPMMI